MKIVIRFFFAIVLLLTFDIHINAQPARTKKIFVAVLDFDARAGIDQGEAASLSDIFSSQLAQSGRFILVERNGIKKILNEQGFQQSEACSSVECIAEVGKILKVEKIFSGTIGKIGKLFTVSVQLINVSSGQIEISKGRQHEGEIEDLATTVIPEVAAEMTKALTGQDMEVDESTTSSPKYKRHEIELGFGSGPKGSWQIFNLPPAVSKFVDEVRIRPKSVLNLAYHYHVGPYFAVGLRMTSFTQTIESFPIFPLTTVSISSRQSLTIRLNTFSFEGKVNFLRGTIEPYATLSLGIATGNIRGDGDRGFLSQRDFDGPALGFGLGSRFLVTNRFGLTLDFRVLGFSGGYKDNKDNTVQNYPFNGDRFDGSHSAAFIILFYQF